MRLMKRLLFIGLAVVAVLTVGVLSVDHYQNYQNKKTHDHKVKVEKEVADVQQAAGAEYKGLEASYNGLRVECEKGLAAYQKLSAFTQKTTPQPVCAPAPVRQ